MRHLRCLPLSVLVLGLPATIAAQSSKPAATPPSATWTAPRTPDGRADLQGVWLIHTATPLERPKALEGKARLTDDEVAEFRRRAERLFNTGNGDFAVGDGVFQAVLADADRYTNPNATHGANEMIDLEFDHRTSLIVDPQDGRLAPLTAEGDSRGHWEGDTLVVDTTNFSRGSYFMGATEHLHLVERFTRVSADTIAYEMAISDPSTWTRPWTAMMPMPQRQETLYEYACHEGNFELMKGMLDGARVQREAETR